MVMRRGGVGWVMMLWVMGYELLDDGTCVMLAGEVALYEVNS